MVAYAYRMPAGIPGEMNRQWHSTIEGITVDPTHPPLAYGLGGQIDATSTKFRVIQPGDTAVYGVLIRPFPAQSNPPNTFGASIPLGTSDVPPTAGLVNVLKRGYVEVVVSGATAPAKNGQVWIWSAASSGAHVQGGFEAATPGGSGFLINNAYWMGAPDTGGNSEIAFEIGGSPAGY